MKKALILFFLALTSLSCEKKEQVVFENIILSNEDCNECPTISIIFPYALEDNKLCSSINTAIKEEIIERLTFDDDLAPDSIEKAMDSFSNGYFDLKKAFPDAEVGWEAKIDGVVSYEDAKYVTIQLNTYIFSGGAHGYESTQFLNFDKKNQTEIAPEEFFKDIEDFTSFAEKKFRKQHDIPFDKEINSTGFMFPEDYFILPENMGFTKEGFQFCYNQYEIASYADGAITLVFSFDEIKKYLLNKNI
jgi:hypothetical protein